MKQEKTVKSDGKAALARMRRRLKSLETLTAEQMKIIQIGQKNDLVRTCSLRAALMSGLDDYVVVLSRLGIILEANEAFARHLGMSRESLLGRNSLHFLHGEARTRRRAVLKNTAETGRIFRFQEEELGRCFDYIFYPLKAVDGNVSELVCIIRDISGIKAAKDDGEDFFLRALVNVMHLAKPCVDKMKKTALTEIQRTYLNIIEMSLDNLMEPLKRDLPSKMPKLSAAEIQVGSLVRFGISTKQIAETLNLAVGTVQTYRRRIRKKLGIRGKKAQLTNHLWHF